MAMLRNSCSAGCAVSVGRPGAAAEPRSGLWRHSPWDGVLVGLALLQGLVLVGWPSLPVVALGLWWNSNTVAHNFIHLPFFHSRFLNRAFALYQTLLLGVPQSLWRARHLAHHANAVPRLRLTGPVRTELVLVLGLWAALAWGMPEFFFGAYLPGYLLGLGLCQLHGYFEHRRETVSHYGAVYNALFFNDGYHVEHHAWPGRHWRDLPGDPASGAAVSRWPAFLRWLEWGSLDSLEQWVLRSSALQRFVLARHERAFRRLLGRLPRIREVAVVGGGLFPRTALILARLLPGARIRIVEADPHHIGLARRFLPPDADFEHRCWEPGQDADCDLVVVPLAFRGDRTRLYGECPSAAPAPGRDRTPRCGVPASGPGFTERCAGAVLVHDWIWRPRGESVVVSWLLLKRLNLVRSRPEVAG